jgi:hypothetical protein
MNGSKTCIAISRKIIMKDFTINYLKLWQTSRISGGDKRIIIIMIITIIITIIIMKVREEYVQELCATVCFKTYETIILSVILCDCGACPVTVME